MVIADRCLQILLTQYLTALKAQKGARPLPTELDDIVRAILLVIAEHSEHLTTKDEVLYLITACRSLLAGEGEDAPQPGALRHVSTEPPSWIAAECFPFDLAAAMLTQSLPLTEGAPFQLLSDHQSSLRQYAFSILWFCRRQVDRDVVLPHLFKDLADTLGYIEEAAGLARGMLDSDEEFFALAALFERDVDFQSQFVDRVADIKSRNLLNRFLDGYRVCEIRIGKLVESCVLRMNYLTGDARPVQLTLLDSKAPRKDP